MFNNYKGANNAQGQLLAGIGAAATTAVLQTGQGGLFPSTFPFFVKIEKYDTALNAYRVLKREIAKVTNRVGDTLTIVRAAGLCPSAYNSTSQTSTAFSFDANDTITQVWVNEDSQDIKTEIARLETDKLNIAGWTLTWTLITKIATPVAAAATVDLNAISGNYVHITGTATITSFWATATGTYEVVFDAAGVVITNGAIRNPTAANITTQAGDTIVVKWEWSGNWRILHYQRKDGTALVAQNVPSTVSSSISGENITAGAPLRKGVILEKIRQLIWGIGSWVTNCLIWYSATNQAVGQSFLVTWTAARTLTSITFRFGKTGAPAGNLTCYVYSNAAGTVLVATSSNTIAETGITGGGSLHTFNFANEVLAAGTYYIKISTSRGNSGSDFSWVDSSDGNYASWDAYTINSSNTWAIATNRDRYFDMTLWTQEVEANVYNTDASNIYRTNFIGFAKSTVTSGQAVTYDTSWVNSNQSWLTINTDYFLSNTPGTISSSPGTYSRRVGFSVTTTEIEVETANNNLVEWVLATTATAGSVVLWNAVGFVTLEINGTERKIPYYSL